MRRSIQNLILQLEAAYDRPFGPKWNPLRQMGTLTFYLFWIVAASGIYLYALFDTTVAGVYQSIEYITNEQWYLGGVMRSLHRYGSDAMVVTAVLHLAREFIFDRYRDVRWFTWFTGVPILWFLLFSGISGYWLVWDELALYIAVASMEWLDFLIIFGEPLANNFLTVGSLNDRFFTLLIFMHIFGPLVLLFIMWIHVIRVSQPKVNPPRGLALGMLAMLIVLSLVKPAVSHGPADLAAMPLAVDLDWFYMLFYPLFDSWGPGPLWAVGVGGSVIVAAMPWLPPLKKPKAAQVRLEDCNGCSRCFDDCPFGAVTMGPRTDGRPFEQQAVVDADLCTACGICVGACPVSTPFRSIEALTTGIDLPDLSLDRLFEITAAAAERAGKANAGRARVVVYGCDHGADVRRLEGPGVAGVSMPCIAMLPPSFIDYLLSRRKVEGVHLTGCRECDCFNRLGNQWMEERIDGLRDPYLRQRVPRERIRICWAGRIDVPFLAGDLEEFRASLEAIAEEYAGGDGK